MHLKLNNTDIECIKKDHFKCNHGVEFLLELKKINK